MPDAVAFMGDINQFTTILLQFRSRITIDSVKIYSSKQVCASQYSANPCTQVLIKKSSFIQISCSIAIKIGKPNFPQDFFFSKLAECLATLN